LERGAASGLACAGAANITWVASGTAVYAWKHSLLQAGMEDLLRRSVDSRIFAHLREKEVLVMGIELRRSDRMIDTAAKELSIIDVLVEQHHQIKDMLLDVAEARGDQKEELFQDVVGLLAVHESAEEHVVHPMARLMVGDGTVDERLNEEKKIKHALVELYELTVSHPGFDRRVRALADEFDKHASKEQTEEFAVLSDKAELAELRRMGGAVVAMEAEIMGRRARLSEGARAHGFTGPPMAVFNRAQEALAQWQRTQ
jgi:hypothetical protein